MIAIDVWLSVVVLESLGHCRILTRMITPELDPLSLFFESAFLLASLGEIVLVTLLDSQRTTEHPRRDRGATARRQQTRCDQ